MIIHLTFYDGVLRTSISDSLVSTIQPRLVSSSLLLRMTLTLTDPSVILVFGPCQDADTVPDLTTRAGDGGRLFLAVNSRMWDMIWLIQLATR